MRVAVGKDDHVARDELHLFLADQAAVAAAFGQDVVRDQVLGGGHDPGRELLGGHGLDAPRLRRLDRVEVGAIEADDTQQVGERVHGQGILAFGRHMLGALEGRALLPIRRRLALFCVHPFGISIGATVRQVAVSAVLALLPIPAITQRAGYRLPQGDTLRYREVTESHVELRLPDRTVTVTGQHDARIALVRERGDTTTAWYEQLILSSATPLGETRPSTDAALHLPFRLILSSAGRVTLLSAPVFPSEIAAQTDLSHQFEDFFVSVPGSELRPSVTWADTLDNNSAGRPQDTYRSRHIRRCRALRDTIVAGGAAAVVIAVEQDMTIRATSPLEHDPTIVGTHLEGREEGTAVLDDRGRGGWFPACVGGTCQASRRSRGRTGKSRCR